MKFKNEQPDKKDHAGLKIAGKALRYTAGTLGAAVIVVLNKNNIKKGLDIAKIFIKK